MEIIWYGHACCALTDDTTTIITDPYDNSLGVELPTLMADIVTVSHDNPRHNAVGAVGGQFKLVDSPGEYEIRQIFISATALYPPQAADRSTVNDRNLVFVYNLDDLTVCHLGDLGHVPNQSQIEGLDNVDILLTPVGGGRSLNAAQAAEVIGLIEPALVIPIHYALPGINVQLDSLDKFLREMGQSQLEAQNSLKITRRNLPEETQIVVLTPTFR